MKKLKIGKSETNSGSQHQKERYLKKNILKNLFLNMKSTTFERTMDKTLCPFSELLYFLKKNGYSGKSGIEYVEKTDEAKGGGAGQMLTWLIKGGGWFCIPPFLPDIICEQPLSSSTLLPIYSSLLLYSTHRTICFSTGLDTINS